MYLPPKLGEQSVQVLIDIIQTVLLKKGTFDFGEQSKLSALIDNSNQFPDFQLRHWWKNFVISLKETFFGQEMKSKLSSNVSTQQVAYF